VQKKLENILKKLGLGPVDYCIIKRELIKSIDNKTFDLTRLKIKEIRMPRLMQQDDNTQEHKIAGPGNFVFSAIRIEDLGASDYTLVTLILDVTGSVREFADALLKMAQSVVKACKKNARSENLLLRYIIFNQSVVEVHGFLPMSSINEDNYDSLNPFGGTALFDAVFSGIGATLKMGESLSLKDFDVNAAVYIVTDGDDNSSTSTPSMIKDQINKALTGEDIESLTTILIGIFDENSSNKQYFSDKLDTFHKDAGLSQYIFAGDATPSNLAKLGNLISESISSTSQALAKGQTASQPLTF